MKLQMLVGCVFFGEKRDGNAHNSWVNWLVTWHRFEDDEFVSLWGWSWLDLDVFLVLENVQQDNTNTTNYELYQKKWFRCVDMCGITNYSSIYCICIGFE